MTLPLILLSLTGLLLLAACYTDIQRFQIPDFIPIAVLALVIPFGLAQPDFSWGWHIAGFALMFAVGLGLFAAGWMGGGDIKLLIATAAWTGLKGLPAFLAGVTLAGGLLALALLASRAALARAGTPPEAMPGPLRPSAPLPYAIAIAGGAFWWAWRSWPLG